MLHSHEHHQPINGATVVELAVRTRRRWQSDPPADPTEPKPADEATAMTSVTGVTPGDCHRLSRGHRLVDHVCDRVDRSVQFLFDRLDRLNRRSQLAAGALLGALGVGLVGLLFVTAATFLERVGG